MKSVAKKPRGIRSTPACSATWFCKRHLPLSPPPHSHAGHDCGPSIHSCYAWTQDQHEQNQAHENEPPLRRTDRTAFKGSRRKSTSLRISAYCTLSWTSFGKTLFRTLSYPGQTQQTTSTLRWRREVSAGRDWWSPQDGRPSAIPKSPCTEPHPGKIKKRPKETWWRAVEN